MSKANNFWELISARFYNELNDTDNDYLKNSLEEESNNSLFGKVEKIHSSLFYAKKLDGADRTSSWNLIAGEIRKNRIRKIATFVSKYAAVLFLAFVLGNFFNVFNRPSEEIKYTEIEVQDGQTSHLFLFDGTEVWLNSGTIFKYPNQFNQQERIVYIDGEAFFKVASNKKIPFKVKTSQLEVKVLGTSFNVSAYRSELKQSVVLVEGAVQINNLQGKKIGSLVPGQIAIQSEETPLQIEYTNPYFYTSWKDGKVVFDAERLGDIAVKLERWYNIEIRFEQESLKDYEFTGTILRNKPINQTIMAFELLAPIHFNYHIRTNEKDVITINAK